MTAAGPSANQLLPIAAATDPRVALPRIKSGS